MNAATKNTVDVFFMCDILRRPTSEVLLLIDEIKLVVFATGKSRSKTKAEVDACREITLIAQYSRLAD